MQNLRLLRGRFDRNDESLVKRALSLVVKFRREQVIALDLLMQPPHELVRAVGTDLFPRLPVYERTQDDGRPTRDVLSVYAKLALIFEEDTGNDVLEPRYPR